MTPVRNQAMQAHAVVHPHDRAASRDQSRPPNLEHLFILPPASLARRIADMCWTRFLGLLRPVMRPSGRSARWQPFLILIAVLIDTVILNRLSDLWIQRDQGMSQIAAKKVIKEKESHAAQP